MIRGRVPRFGVGDTIHIPGTGPVSVEKMGRRYFSGTSTEGVKVGRTGIGLAAGEKLGKEPEPWTVEKKGEE